MSTEWIHLYLAGNLEKNGSGGGVDDEDIIVHEVPPSSFLGWVSEMRLRGYMIDLKFTPCGSMPNALVLIGSKNVCICLD